MKGIKMNIKLKTWLDEHAEIQKSANDATWHYESDGKGGRSIVLDTSAGTPWIGLFYSGNDINPIYTDCLSYCYHDFGCGNPNDASENSAARDEFIRRIGDIANDYMDDGELDAAAVEQDLQEYIHDRAGFCPDLDYYDVPNCAYDDRFVIDFFGIAHDENADVEVV